MIKKIKELLSKKEFTGRIKLPMDGLSSVVKFYEPYKGTHIPALLVVIYNVDQLADAIVKRLKDSTDNGGKSDNDGN